MVSFVFVIVSIFLAASLAAMSVNYVPAAAMERQQIYKETLNGLRSLQGSTERYLEHNRGPNGFVSFPGAGYDMASSITPTFGFMPADVRDALTWQVATGNLFGSPAVYICARPKTSNASARMVLSKIQSQLPSQSAYLGGMCGQMVNQSGGDHLTVWMMLSHYDNPQSL